MGFCVNCGIELPPEAGFCPKCGTKVEIPRCPACGKEVDFDADFCLYCGARLHELEPEPSQPDSATEPETQSKQVTVNEAKDEAAPTPEPVAEKKAEIPDICPRCGKAPVRGYDHCTYCGTYWEQAMPSADKTMEKPAEKAAETLGQKTAADPEQRFFRDFSWSYKRATSRWTRQRTEIKVEVDDQRLHCTDTRNLRRPAVVEEEIQLKDISKITLAARASFWCWMAFALALTVMVAVPFLPAMGIPLAVSEGEMLPILALVGVFLAIELWWVRFNTYHHRLVISGTGDSGQKEIVLEALKPDVLRELQAELTQRTGIQPQKPEGEDTASTKATLGVIMGALLAVAIFVLVANQSPNTTPASSTRAGGSSTVSQSQGTTKSASIQSGSNTRSLEKEILGCWEFQYALYYDDGRKVTKDSDIAHFWFYDDNTYEFLEGNSYSAGDWSVVGNAISLTSYYDDDKRTITLDDNSFILKKTDKEVGYRKLSSDPAYIPDGLNLSSDDTYDLSFLIGSWEDTVYENPGYACLTFSSGSNGDIDVTYTVPRADELHGKLKVDGDGDLYVDMVSIYSASNNPEFRLYIFYDGYGLDCIQNYTDGDRYTPYFVKW